MWRIVSNREGRLFGEVRTWQKTVRNLTSIRWGGRGPVLFAAALVLYIALVVLICRLDWVGHIGDDASYVGAAKGLSQWAGYAQFERPDVIPETKHPPGFPLLILPLLWAGLDQIPILQMVTGMFGFASLVLLSCYEGSTGRLVAALTGLNFYWLLFCGHLLSEIPYCFMLLLLCRMVHHCAKRGEITLKARVALAFTLGFSILLKTIGVILVPLLLVVLWRKRLPIKEWILIPLYSALFIAPYYFYSAVSGYRDDVAGYPGVIEVLKTNVPYWLEALPFLMGVTSRLVDLTNPGDGVVALLLFSLICWSVWTAFKEGLELEVLALLGFGAVLLVWPFQDPRLFVPTIPLLLLIVLRGGGLLFSNLGIPRPYYVAFAILLAAEVLRISGPLASALRSTPPHSRPPVLGRLDELAGPGDVVVADDPGVWLQCKTPVFPLASEERILKVYEAWMESMAMVDARFLLLAKDLDHGRSLSMGESRSSSEARLMQTVLNRPDTFQKVGEDGRFVLFEITADPRKTRLAAGWFRIGHQKFFESRTGAEELQKALAIEPSFPVARFFLAHLLLQHGRTDEAVEQLETLLGYQPFFDDARVLLAELRGR